MGFLVIVAGYLWLQMERRMNRYAGAAGMLAFLWRLVLTTGTGCIFGFLVAREAYDSAVMAPLFIAMSFSFGLAVYILVLLASYHGAGREVGDVIIRKLGRLLGVFAAAVLYFTAIQHLANLYAAEHIGVERFILLDGGIYTWLFWFGQVLVGGILPMLLVFKRGKPDKGLSARTVSLASILVILGGFAQIYVIVIGGQAYPLNMFPGMEVSSSFNDGVIASYAPSLPEIGLGLGGIALTGLLLLVGLKVLRFMPETLSNAAIDPHHGVKAESA